MGIGTFPSSEASASSAAQHRIWFKAKLSVLQLELVPSSGWIDKVGEGEGPCPRYPRALREDLGTVLSQPASSPCSLLWTQRFVFELMGGVQ